jgi:hypothetical protein
VRPVTRLGPHLDVRRRRRVLAGTYCGTQLPARVSGSLDGVLSPGLTGSPTGPRQAGAGQLPGQQTRPVINSFKPGQAGRSLGALRRGWLRGGRWLLPWLAVLLVSASLESATTSALTGAWVPTAVRSASSPTLAIAELPSAGAVGDGDDARALELACISRSVAYSASWSDTVRRCSGCCGIRVIGVGLNVP